MANLPESPQWEDGIYQIEVSDPVLGGPDGISNRQAKQLASRTSYLKQKVEKGGADLAAHIAAADPHTQYAPKASPTFTGTPTAPTPAANDNSKKLVTTEFVARSIAALAGTAPETLDTLKELADALGNDPNFATTVLNKLAEKLAKDQNGADIPDPALFVKNLGLDDTIIKAGKAFSQTKVSDVVGENGVPWNAPSGLYSARYESYTAMIVHFNMGSGSCPAFQLKIHYRNGGVYYRSARDGFGFERDWELVGSDAAPVGIPMPWPTALPPSGWLKCNGSPFDKSKYPQLALAYPAGYLPDLRGEFIRGWDDGRGADNNRALLSAQLGTALPSMYVYATSATKGTLVTQPISAFGDNFPIDGRPVDTEGVENTPSGGSYFSTGELSPNGLSSLIKYRVRPRNIAFNYIVRAA
ncbi:MAG: phage tail protein [Yersinia sp. (in: enterobacteria)]